MQRALGPGPVLERAQPALVGTVLGALLAGACTSATESLRSHAPHDAGTDPWALPAQVVHASTPRRPALVVHSAGLDALLADPRDAGLRRALALLDERLLELPDELEGFTPPPGLVEFLAESLGAPWTLELDVPDGGASDAALPFGVRARWTVHAASVERAALLDARFSGLLARAGLASSSARGAGEPSEVATPAGSLFHGAQAGDGAFVVAWGEPARTPAVASTLELPAGAAPVLTLELDVSALVAPCERLLAAADPSGRRRRQLEAMGLLGGAPLGLELAVGHASDRAVLVSRYRNWAEMARATGALVREPLPREALELVPADATLVSLSRTEPLAILRALESLEGGAEARAHVHAALGLDLGLDLLEPLGQTLGFYMSDATGGGGLASAVLFVALDEQERLERSLEVLAERLNDHAIAALDGRVRVRTFEHRGTTCLGLTVPGFPLPFEPSLAIRRRHLFVAATPQALAGALDHARGNAPGLRAHPGLRSLAPGALDDLQGLFFSDVPRLARDGYGLASLVTSALANGVRSSTEMLREPGLVLPPYRELVTGARPTLLLARIQGEDLVSVGQADRSAVLHLTATLGWAPTALSGLSLMAGAVTGLVRQPQAEKAEENWEQEVEAKAQTDIWALMNALHSYAIQNSGRYPESLGALVIPDANGFTLLNSTELPRDPWGRDYVYELNGNEPRVLTYGADRVPGGEGLARDVDSQELEADLGGESTAKEGAEPEKPEQSEPQDGPKD